MDGLANIGEPLTTLIAALRDARFCHGRRCARCGGTRVQRWGFFSGRQRYRCRECGRTFSDLTGTPAAYRKKLELWPAYSRCMSEGLSVRRSAAEVGIHPSTAFRWRHAMLSWRQRGHEDMLEGWIEIGCVAFHYSQKGQRRLGRAPRRRGIYCGRKLLTQRVSVVVACDRQGNVVTARAFCHRPSIEDLETTLVGRTDSHPTVIAACGRFGRAAAFARRQGGSFHDARIMAPRPPGPLVHIRTVHGYANRLKKWIARFRGVATRYLPNYLLWHREVDRSWRHGVSATLLRWPLGDSSN